MPHFVWSNISPPQKRQNASTPNKRLSIEPVYTPSACLTAASAACFACRPSCCCCSCSPLHHPVAAVMLLQPPATAGLCHGTSHLSKCPSSPSRACARQRSPPPPHAALLQRSRRFTLHTAQSSWAQTLHKNTMGRRTPEMPISRAAAGSARAPGSSPSFWRIPCIRLLPESTRSISKLWRVAVQCGPERCIGARYS